MALPQNDYNYLKESCSKLVQSLNWKKLNKLKTSFYCILISFKKYQKKKYCMMKLHQLPHFSRSSYKISITIEIV